ncbi:hypothetical protein RND71_017996 [Anisodus tanguticus]|uniref:Uncharacterized protein n=1 Tax=Anisodus tanguticus TaxID=243964 RepID=A0AAE1VJQ6_9SOLA|nr:hypothetical protein RND71_017996 [Anisodus tanguticus]
MESSRKRRTEFIKGKLVKSLYRSAAPTVPSSTTQYGHSPLPNYISEDSAPRAVYHLHLHHHQPKEKLIPFNPNNIIALSSSFSSDAVGFIMNQEQAAPPQKPKVSYYIPPQSTTTAERDFNGITGTCYARIDTDESVDIKATNYISYVQEPRFKCLLVVT